MVLVQDLINWWNEERALVMERLETAMALYGDEQADLKQVVQVIEKMEQDSDQLRQWRSTLEENVADIEGKQDEAMQIMLDVIEKRRDAFNQEYAQIKQMEDLIRERFDDISRRVKRMKDTDKKSKKLHLRMSDQSEQKLSELRQERNRIVVVVVDFRHCHHCHYHRDPQHVLHPSNFPWYYLLF